MNYKGFWGKYNFGDALTPIIVKEITGKNLIRTKKAYLGTLIGIGSIISRAEEGCIVWGSGIIIKKDRVNPNADFRAVRGPLSRDRVLECGGDCPEIYGDPALLLPRFYQPKVEKKFKLGIFSHYVNYKEAIKKFGNKESITVINALCKKGSPLLKVNQICECEKIMSSSLHGLIVAQAYGIPAKWIKFSNPLGGDGIKFLDYFLSTNQKPQTAFKINNNLNIVKLEQEINQVQIKIDLDKLWKSCPFK